MSTFLARTIIFATPIIFIYLLIALATWDMSWYLLLSGLDVFDRSIIATMFGAYISIWFYASYLV